MIEDLIKDLLYNFGFPVFVAGVLLWDKMKTNGNLLQVVRNNNQILCEIQNTIYKKK